MSPVADRSPARKSLYSDIEVELAQIAFQKILTAMMLAMIAVAGTTSIMAHHYKDYRLWYFNVVVLSISLVRVALIFGSGPSDCWRPSDREVDHSQSLAGLYLGKNAQRTWAL